MPAAPAIRGPLLGIQALIATSELAGLATIRDFHERTREATARDADRLARLVPMETGNAEALPTRVGTATVVAPLDPGGWGGLRGSNP